MPAKKDLLFLTGMLGSGKTRVGKLLARQLGWKFYDTDHEVEAAAGMTIAALFEKSGEARFRRLESDALRSLKGKGPAVVATGGGLPLRSANRSFMKAVGINVHLSVPTAVLARRLKAASIKKRPLLKNGLSALKTLARARAKIYAEADLVVLASESPAKVAAELKTALRTMVPGFLP
ncbi:MAG: shikimate kinase [candidate division FCPU426 bacterium]